MDREILSQPPHAQCYVCHKANLDELNQVCHHCGRAICNEHVAAPVFAWSLFAPLFHWLDFNGVALPGATRKQIVHCKKCADSHWRFRRLAQDLLRLVEPLLPDVADWKLFRRLPLPIAPARITAALTEDLWATIRLDEQGNYSAVTMTPTTGRLALTIQFTNLDRERIANYRRSRNLVQGAAMPFHAGFVILKNIANLQLPVYKVVQPSTFALKNDARHFPFLDGSNQTEGAQWAATYEYTVVRADKKAIALPVQIVPTVVQDDLRCSLEVEIRLRPDVEKIIKFDRAQIDEFALYYGDELGSPKRIRPAPSASAADQQRSAPRIVWHNAYLLQKETPHAVFRVRFEHELHENITLTGILKLTFNGAISGVDGARFYHPWGSSVTEQPDLKRNTQLTIGFTLKLKSLAFHASYTAEPTHVNLHGLTPNTEFVSQLVSELAAQGIYVRRLSENRAFSDPTTAEITNQQIDLEGRQYTGVDPIDIHVVVAGENANGPVHSSQIQVDITTQGMADCADERAEIDAVRDNVVSAIESLAARLTPPTQVRWAEQKRAEQLILLGNAQPVATLAKEVIRQLRPPRRPRRRFS